jgi:hypothetical protein
VLAIILGLISGAAFNLAASRYAQLQEQELPGKFYGADLFGAAMGGLITTVLILPLVGIQAGFVVLSLGALLVAVHSYASA